MKRILVALVGLTLFGAAASASLYFSESFSYSDGPVTSVAAGVWAAHSGTTGMNVSNGALRVAGADSLDVNRSLGSTVSTGDIFAGFQLTVTTQPSGTTREYFTHFSDNSTGFRGRVFTTNGASVGAFRLGLANGASSPNVLWGSELSVGTTYLVVLRYHVDGTPASQLWVNPVSSNSTSVTASDTASVVSLTRYAFRQPTAAGMGILSVDDLRVGTTFADVIPEPASATLMLAFPALAFARRRLRRQG